LYSREGWFQMTSSHFNPRRRSIDRGEHASPGQAVRSPSRQFSARAGTCHGGDLEAFRRW
jgi:hypothetical protein